GIGDGDATRIVIPGPGGAGIIGQIEFAIAIEVGDDDGAAAEQVEGAAGEVAAGIDATDAAAERIVTVAVGVADVIAGGGAAAEVVVDIESDERLRGSGHIRN